MCVPCNGWNRMARVGDIQRRDGATFVRTRRAGRRRADQRQVGAAPRAPRRVGDPSVYAAAARIRNELGWVPRCSTLDAIVADAWRWHSTHPFGRVTTR